MKNYFVLILIISVTKLHASITLNESFKKALIANYQSSIGDSKINQANEDKSIARSNFLPKVYLKGTYLKQENLTDTKTYNLNLTQSLFKGGKDLDTLNKSSINLDMAKHDKDYQEQILYSNVVTNYFNFLLYLNDQKNLELLKKLSNDRYLEIKKRVAIGRSRKGELLQAETQLASVDAQVLNGNGLLNEARDKFLTLIGESDKTIEIIFEDSKIEENKTLDDFKNMMSSRPDLKSKQLKVSEVETDIKNSRGSHFPTLDLSSNYYLNKRTSTYRNTNWDASLVLTFPLFEGGGTDAKVSQYIYKKEEATYSFKDLQKQIELDVESKYQTFHRYNDQIKAFELAFTKSKENYEEALKDYRLGLMSNLDLLSAMNLYLDSKRNYEKNKIQAMMSLKQLYLSVGRVE